jgi:hypothetical protein
MTMAVKLDKHGHHNLFDHKTLTLIKTKLLFTEFISEISRTQYSLNFKILSCSHFCLALDLQH